MAFSNPATAYSLGFALGFIYHKVIEEPLLRFAVNPVLLLVKSINKKILELHKNEPEFITKIKHLFSELKDFFTPEEGVLYPLGLLYKIAKKLNFDYKNDFLDVAKKITDLGGPFYNSLKNIMMNGMFSVNRAINQDFQGDIYAKGEADNYR